MNKIEIPEINKQIILKLICNEIMKRDISNDVECLKELIINDEMKYFLIRLKYGGRYIFINEDSYETGIIDIDMYIDVNKFYFYSRDLEFERGFAYFSRDTNPMTFKLIERLVNLENEQDKKILQCVALCKSLIKLKCHRPYDYTQDIMSCY